MNLKSIVLTSIFLLVIGFIVGSLIGTAYENAFNNGWNAAIDATPKGVLFNYKLEALSLNYNELPWYADNKPFCRLKNPATSVKFSHNGKVIADTLVIAGALPLRRE